MPIVEEVAEGGAASADNSGQAATCGGGDFLKFFAVDTAEQQWTLRVGGAPLVLVRDGVDVTVGDEEVEKSIIIEIEEAGAPTEKRYGGMAKTGLEGDVRECGAAIVPVESFVVVGKRGDEEIQLAVAIVIAESDAHGGLRAAFFAKCETRCVADVLKSTVSAIAIEIVGAGIIGDGEVGPAVVVEVSENGREAVAKLRVGDGSVKADVGEGAVAIVVEKVIGFTEKAEWAAKNIHAAILTRAGWNATLSSENGMVDVEVHVTGDEEIEKAVAVEVSPGWSGGPAAESYAGFFGDVGEGAVVIIVVEAILAKVSDVDVGPTVVVVIGDGCAEAPALVGDARLGSDVGEGTIVIVVEESGARGGLGAFHGGNGRAVDEVDVEPTVVVVIEESDAGAGGIEDGGFFWGARALMEAGEAGLPGDIFEDDGSVVNEAARGNRAMERVADWRVSTAGGHAARTNGRGTLLA